MNLPFLNLPLAPTLLPIASATEGRLLRLLAGQYVHCYAEFVIGKGKYTAENALFGKN